MSLYVGNNKSGTSTRIKNKQLKTYGLLGLHLITLMLLLLILIEIPHHSTSSKYTFVIVMFAFIALPLLLIIKKLIKEGERIESNKDLYLMTLSQGYEFFILLNESREIIFHKLDKKFKRFQASAKLENILEHLKIKKSVQKHIFEALYNEENMCEKTDIVIGYKPQRTQIIVDTIYKNQSFFVIKGIKCSDYTSDLFDKLGCGYYELDDVGNIINCNDFFARILGYDREELKKTSLNLSDIIHSNFNLRKQQSHQAQSNSYLNTNWQGLVTFLTKYKESLYTIIVQKIFFEENGDFDKIIGYMIKLPNKNLVTKAKGVDESWFDYGWQCFFVSSPYPVVIINKSCDITKFNSALELLTPHVNVYKNFFEFFHDEDVPIISEEINSLVSDVKTQPTCLKELRLKQGNKIVNLLFGRIFDLDGNLFGLITSFTDITQQKELEVNLSHAQRMQTMGYLAGSIAHDFNNLLTAIIGFTDILLLKHPDGDPSFSSLMQIRQSSNRAANLVSRLLAFSKRQTLKPVILNLNEFFSDFRPLITRLINANIEFSQSIQPNLWHIKVDNVQFEQVVLNLIVNAHQAMDTSGRLSVEVFNMDIKRDNPYMRDFIIPVGGKAVDIGEYVAISIEDTGCGIDSSIIAKVFEPFFTTKHDQFGTGLGLSTVHGIINQSDGYLYFKTKVGVGTTFLVLMKRYVLKAEDEERMKVLNLSDFVKSPISEKQGIIVLVEDEEAVRLFATQILKSKGYEVLDFPTAIDAKDYLQKHDKQIELLITDVIMPQMTGPALVEELKKTRSNLKVIFISGYGEDVFDKTYGSSRDFNFLPKPFNLKDLLLRVKEVMNKDAD